MAWGYAPPMILSAAVHHRIFDLLDGGPKTAAEMSKANGASLRGVRAIMNALTSFELLTKDAGERYALTPESATFLVKGKPGYIGGFMRHGDALIPKWLKLPEIVQSGKPAMAVNREDDGSAFFESFVEDLFGVNFPPARALAATLPNENRVLDIAAGSAVWSIPLAQRSKEVRVTAVDWPGVLATTRRITERFGVSEQYEFSAGNIETIEFGDGYDVAVLGHILHSQGERKSRDLLGKVFRALAPGGTIVIAEFLANDGRSGPPMPMLFAVNMVVNTEDGDTFTVPEISNWLTKAGFEKSRVLEVPSPSPLILANKPA